MTDDQPGLMWLGFALMTVTCFGLYGVFLHSGQQSMADPVNGRFKAFLFVGTAYFLAAVLAPLAVLIVRNASWDLPGRGIALSLVAGLLGATGAFCILLAFGARGTPAAVMSIVFAGAPVVNAVVATLLHPPAGGIRAVSPLFFLGILLAAAGGGMVMLFRPTPAPPPARTSLVEPAAEPPIAGREPAGG